MAQRAVFRCWRSNASRVVTQSYKSLRRIRINGSTPLDLHSKTVRRLTGIRRNSPASSMNRSPSTGSASRPPWRVRLTGGRFWGCLVLTTSLSAGAVTSLALGAARCETDLHMPAV